jgi:DNA polymerase III alpha subunit
MKPNTEGISVSSDGFVVDKFGQMIFDTNQVADCLLSRPGARVSEFFVTQDTEYRRAVQALLAGFELPRIYDLSVLEKSQEEFDAQQQNTWLVPGSYRAFDIFNWMLERAPDDLARNRVITEYQLYEQYQLVDFLRFLKYMVDELRKNNIVLGLGRGSSVSSYCLYLIGAHRINPLKYDLDISEFLR